MRVLLAIDGSMSSNRARDLVAGLPWPDGSVVRIVGVLERGPELFGLPWIPVIPENAAAIEADLVARMQGALEAAERDIARPGRAVDQLLPARPRRSRHRDQAREFGAEYRRGSRATRRGTMLWIDLRRGVDIACPVLVARGRVGSVILAEDVGRGAGGRRVPRRWRSGHPRAVVAWPGSPSVGRGHPAPTGGESYAIGRRGARDPADP